MSGRITPQVVINIIRKNFPELHDRVIEGVLGKLTPDGVAPTEWDGSRSCEIVGQDWEYIGLETTVMDTVGDLLEREKKWGIDKGGL